MSEIPGHWIDAIAAERRLRWSVRAPVGYPSDPQPLPGDEVLLADYSSPGHVVIIDRHGHVAVALRADAQGQAELNHPSLAIELPNGDIAVNDDYRDRVVVIDPRQRPDRLAVRSHRRARGPRPDTSTSPTGWTSSRPARGGGLDWAATVHP